MASYWTQDEASRALMLAKAGYTGAQIGLHLGRSKSSVLTKLRRMGFKKSPIRPLPSADVSERDRLMIADCLAGMSHRQLSEKYGLEIGSVSARLSHLGVRVPMSERVRRQREAMKRNGTRPGRTAIWPDCPSHLRREYLALRKHHGVPAAEARKALEEMA